MLRSLISQTSSVSLPLLLRQCLASLLTHSRAMAFSSNNPRKRERIRDYGFDGYMDIEKKNRTIHSFQDLILTQSNSMLSMARLDHLARRIGFKMFEAGQYVLKFPHVFEVFEHPVQRILFCRLTRKALQQIKFENEALLAQIPEAVTRLRKLIMLSNTGRLRLEHVRIARKEFGLPDDFELSVILKHPQYFTLLDAKETRNKYIELVERDPKLAVCAIESLREEEYRRKGGAAEDIRFAFIVNFPPGFKIGHYYNIAVRNWQRLPYWSPYENVSGFDMRSLEAQKRMEKTAVATIHELLSLTVEKKITLERIAHFRMAMNLPTKMKNFLLQHQGIFYISTRGNRGKLLTVFLREAYRKGELLEPNDLYWARRHLGDLVLMNPRTAKVDKELFEYQPKGRWDKIRDNRRDCMDKGYGDHLIEGESRQGQDTRESVNSDLDHGSDSDFTDEDKKREESIVENN